MDSMKVLAIPHSKQECSSRNFRLSWLEDEFHIEYFIPHKIKVLLDSIPFQCSLNECLVEAEKTKSKQYDCIIGEDIQGLIWGVIFRLVGVNIPIVIIAHSNPYGFIGTFATLLFSQASFDYDVIVPGSLCSCKIYSYYGLRTVRIPVGIATSLFCKMSVKKIPLKKHVGLPPNEKIILYTGRFALDKNVRSLINCFAMIRKYNRSVRLVVCSHIFESQYYDKLESTIKRLNIITVRDVHRSRLTKIYNAADIFVTPSTSPFETFGRSPLEAMMCGLPAITADYGPFREIVPVSLHHKIAVESRGGLKYINELLLAEKIIEVLDKSTPVRHENKPTDGLNRLKDYDDRLCQKRLKLLINTEIAPRLKYFLNNKTKRTIDLKKCHPILKDIFYSFQGRSLIGLFHRMLRFDDKLVDFYERNEKRYRSFIFAHF